VGYSKKIGRGSKANALEAYIAPSAQKHGEVRIAEKKRGFLQLNPLPANMGSQRLVRNHQFNIQLSDCIASQSIN